MLTLATDDTGGPEIFASLQGEGASQGVPCAFIRLSRCNLACVWCDTAYTWRFDGDARPHRAGLTYERKANQVALTPLEAALSGCALILGDSESLREVWEDAALYVLPDSRTSLRDQITSLIEEPYLLAGYAQRAHEHAMQFNPQRQAASYMNLYRNACRRKEVQPCASYSSITH